MHAANQGMRAANRGVRVVCAFLIGRAGLGWGWARLKRGYLGLGYWQRCLHQPPPPPGISHAPRLKEMFTKFSTRCMFEGCAPSHECMHIDGWFQGCVILVKAQVIWYQSMISSAIYLSKLSYNMGAEGRKRTQNRTHTESELEI